MAKIFKILPHMLIVLALAFVVIEILDWYNPYMNFLGLHVSSILMIVFCLLSLVQSARMIFWELLYKGWFTLPTTLHRLTVHLWQSDNQQREGGRYTSRA